MTRFGGFANAACHLFREAGNTFELKYWLVKLCTVKAYAKLVVSLKLGGATSLNLALRRTIMTPVKPQISKFKAEKSCQVGFNVSRRLYS